MNWITKLTVGLKSLFQKQRVERELDEELESYVEASAAHKQIAGMTAEAAHRAAMVEMGSRNAVKHRVWSSRWESTRSSCVAAPARKLASMSWFCARDKSSELPRSLSSSRES